MSVKNQFVNFKTQRGIEWSTVFSIPGKNFGDSIFAYPDISFGAGAFDITDAVDRVLAGGPGTRETVWTLTNGNTVDVAYNSATGFTIILYINGYDWTSAAKYTYNHPDLTTLFPGYTPFALYLVPSVLTMSGTDYLYITLLYESSTELRSYYVDHYIYTYFAVDGTGSFKIFNQNMNTAQEVDGILRVLYNGTVVDLFDPYTNDDNQTPEGGYGDFDYTSEEVLPSPLPSLSAAQVGFVSLWNPTESEMQSLAQYLWTGTFDWTNFRKLFTNPMECVLSVGLIPITPTRKQSGGSDVKEEIVFGGSSHSGVNAYPVTQQFYNINMGTLHIGGKSKSAMDYSPYSKASIYLPYCGTYALDVDEIMDSDIALEYHIDIYTGACVAYLTINGHINSDGKTVHAVMYQFTGNVLASIPITGNDHSQFIQSMLIMGATAAATVATSGAGAGAAASGADLGAETAATGFNKALASSAINTVMSMKPNVLHSGNLSSTAGLLGGQQPYITMTWSNLCRPEDEQKLIGMPLHKSGTLSQFSGFTIVSSCHMDHILCTEQELAMIEQALSKGVIV